MKVGFGFSGFGFGTNAAAGLAAPYNAAASALFARMSVQPDAARKNLINNLIVSLINSGVWTKLDCFYVLAAHDAQAAGLNWIGATNNLTAVNSPTFTTDRGYAGDGLTSYLDTGYMFPAGNQNSCHLSAYPRSSTTETNSVTMGNANAVISVRRVADEQTFTRVCGATSFQTTTLDAKGLWTASRTGALTADFALYRNGVAQSLLNGSGSEAPDATYPMWLLARNGAVPTYTPRQFAAYSIGDGLTAGEAANLYTSLLTYLTAVGAA